jgi:hypothetical protein
MAIGETLTGQLESGGFPAPPISHSRRPPDGHTSAGSIAACAVAEGSGRT